MDIQTYKHIYIYIYIYIYIMLFTALGGPLYKYHLGHPAIYLLLKMILATLEHKTCWNGIMNNCTKMCVKIQQSKIYTKITGRPKFY